MGHEQRIDVCRRNEHGIDLEQLEYNLSLTPDQRLRQLMGWVEFAEVVRGERDAGKVERNVGC